MLYSAPEKLLTFFGIQCIEIVMVSLTNDVVSFEQQGPGITNLHT